MTSKKYFKPILIFILVAGFLAYEMAIQVSPGIITKQLMESLHIDAFSLGVMAGCYYYTYTLLQVPAGLLLDRYSVGKLIPIPILVCAIGAIIFGLATTVIEASIARMLMGIGSAFAFIAVLVVAAEIFPAKHFALLAGMTQLLAAIGAMVGGWPLVPFFATLGWRQGMSYLGVIGIAIAILIAVWGRYPKPHRIYAAQSANFLMSLRAILGNMQTWYIACYACLLWAPMAAFASLWGVPYLQSSYHLSASHAAAFTALLWIGIAIGSPLIGWWSEKLSKRKLPLAIAAGMGFISLGLIIYGPQWPLWLLAILLLLVGAACSGQALSFAVVKENNLPSNNAAAIGFNNMAVVIAGAIFQPLIGKLIHLHANNSPHGVIIYSSYDYRFGLTILPVCFALALLLSLLLIRETLKIDGKLQN